MTIRRPPRLKYQAARKWHLATTDRDASLTDFEFSLLQSLASFERWAHQATRLVTSHALTFSEIVLLHLVHMHDRPKDAATLAKLLNRDDLPNVLYSLRKLISLGLVEKSKSGAVTLYRATAQGAQAAERYAELRHDILMPALESVADIDERIPASTQFLGRVTTYFETAAREIATRSPDEPLEPR